MKEPGGRPAEPRWLHLVAGALMAGGPVWHYLYVNHYPFARVEAFLLPVAAALLGASVAAVAHRIGGLVGSLIFGTLLFGFTDLQFDLQEYFFTAGVLLGCIGLSLLLRERRATIACLSLGAFYAASLPRPALTPPLAQAVGATVPQNGKPLLLHIILDEQWGVGGLRAAGDTATAAFLRKFYLERGFEIYEGAYSRSSMTEQSVPDMLSLGETATVTWPSPGMGRVTENPYFERLQKLGFSILAYQTNYFDYCHSPGAPVVGCSVVPFNSIANVGHLGGKWTRRAIMAGHYFLKMNSHIYVRLRTESPAGKVSIAGGGLATAKEVRNALATRPLQGMAFFVHLLLPHRPFEFDAECRVIKDPADRDNGGYGRSKEAENRAHTMTLEADQILCAHKVLADLIATLDQAVGRDGAIVLVHGDHGSRLFEDESKSGLSELTGPELNSLFSTLLAIRRPGVPAAVHLEPVPVQDFIWELAGNGFVGEVRGPWRHYLRKEPSKENPADTLRTLDASEMPWVKPPP